MATAIIGTGISGLGCAYRSASRRCCVVFEADKVGGHTAQAVSVTGGDYTVDTGFIVYNDWTYPEFISLMKSWASPISRPQWVSLFPMTSLTSSTLETT